MSIGDRLKEARQESGLSFKEIQDSIKVRTKYLQALEEENYKLIPGEAYVRAFIKGYGNFLGLNGKELVEEYKEKLKKEREALEKELEQEEEEQSTGLFQNKIISSIIVIIVLLVIFFVVYNIFLLNKVSNNYDHESQTISKDITSEINQPELPLTITDNLTQAALPENSKKKSSEQPAEFLEEQFNIYSDESDKIITVMAIKRSWLQVAVDGRIDYEGIIEKEQTIEFQGKNVIELKIGNAAGIKVKKGEEILGPWGNEGEVIRKVIRVDTNIIN